MESTPTRFFSAALRRAALSSALTSSITIAAPMTTMAAIDRVVHHSVILDLMGLESFRAQEANGHPPRAGPTAQVAPSSESGIDGER